MRGIFQDSKVSGICKNIRAGSSTSAAAIARRPERSATRLRAREATVLRMCSESLCRGRMASRSTSRGIFVPVSIAHIFRSRYGSRPYPAHRSIAYLFRVFFHATVGCPALAWINHSLKASTNTASVALKSTIARAASASRPSQPGIINVSDSCKALSFPSSLSGLANLIASPSDSHAGACLLFVIRSNRAALSSACHVADRTAGRGNSC